MKKCPFCHADIEDNARFCVFCMSSLQEKQKIENDVNDAKRWPYLIAAFLLLVLIFGMSFWALSNGKNGNAGVTTDNSVIDNISVSDNTSIDDSSINNNTSIDSSTGNDSSADSSTNNDSSIDNSIVDNNSQNNSVINSSSSSPINGPSSSQTTPQSSDDTSSSDSTIQPQPATFLYRDATASDCYTENNIPATPIENVIVITGVASAATDGIYTIPDTIDGKRVGGIMPYAFCDPNISATVKKVVIPAGVKTIWQNAFADCYNLSDIYLCSKTIDIFENSFAAPAKRNDELTIHCASDCKTFGFYFYRNIAQTFDASYKEWNGGDVT